MGTQPLFLLCIGTCVGEQVGVALVGGGDVEGDVGERRITGLFEDDRTADVAEPETAEGGVDVRAEQTGVGSERLELAAEVVVRAMAAGAGVALEGDHGVGDEGTGAVTELDEVCWQAEIDHGEPLWPGGAMNGCPDDHSRRQNHPPMRPAP